jgi:2-polyprenyl-6-methoxyphenol hydroxylase-like FAD-dependent oxidoreductase
MGNVVVIGAGPTGLWVAAELRLRGVGVTVVDERPERITHAKGFTIQPRTMELWAARGLDERLVKQGTTVPHGHFGLLNPRMDFSELDTPFPYTLILPQPIIEETLEEYARDLGADIRRGHRFTRLDHHTDGVVAHIQAGDDEYRLEADYLIGCDGTRSAVRRSAGIEFPGTDATLYSWLADAALDNPPERTPYHVVNAAGSLLVVPIGPDLYRVGSIDPSDHATNWTGWSVDELRAKTAAIAGTDFGLRDPVWVSRFGNSARLAKNYRAGRVLIAGDAAHRHMPAGGLGLNVGAQDAWNLGWKLAATLQGWAPDGLLDSYHDERQPVGAELLESTEAQTVLMTAYTTAGLYLRSFLGKAIDRQPEFSRYLAEHVAGLSTVYTAAAPGAHPLVGHRAPDLRFVRSGGLFDLLKAGHHVLLDLDGGKAASAWTGTGRPRLVVHTDTLADSRPVWDGVRAALIRPDGHVAWASAEPDDDALHHATVNALTAAGH